LGLCGDAEALIVRRMSSFNDASNLRVGTFFNSCCLLFSSNGMLPMTVIDLCTMFSDDERCRELLERLKWPSGPECPRCRQSNPVRLANQSKIVYCKECDYQFTVTANTIFHDSHLPLIKWLTATFLICESRKGMSANQMKRIIGVSYKTAWYLCHRIRAAMASAEKGKLDGTVEMDETYVGGTKHGRRLQGRRDHKQRVIGIKQRSGELRFFRAEDAKSGTLARYIHENISQDIEILITDELSAYKRAVGSIQHETVHRSAGEYVRPGTDITTNGIESAFSLHKRGIMGSWHKVSAKHLRAYLEEMTFLFNRRNSKTIFMETLQHMITADPLSYEKLTA
jgi:transposase-like protein